MTTDYFGSTELMNLLAKHGDKLMFLVKMRPLHHVHSMKIIYRVSSDTSVVVPAFVDERHYAIADNYKIELRSPDENFGSESFYVTDLCSLIREGQVQIVTPQQEAAAA